MKYNKHIYGLIAFFIALSITKANAQVTIGADVAPENFSLVQVEGTTGGVLLPRFTATERATLQTSFSTKPAEAVGMVIYNTTSSRIEFWDGSAWSEVQGVGARNGVEILNISGQRYVGLGGDLEDATTQIDQKNLDLNFKHSTGGTYQIAASTVKDGVVELKSQTGGTFSINNTVVTVSGNSVTLKPSSMSFNTDLFTAAKNATTSPGFEIKEGKYLKYEDGNQNSGYLLAKENNNGEARWDALRPLGTVMTGTLSNSTNFAEQKSGKDITVKPLILSPGKWLVFAKYSGEISASSEVMYHWLDLKQKPVVGGAWSTTSLIGSNPEILGSGKAYSTPNVVVEVEIAQQTEFRVYAATSNKLSDTTTSANGGSYFYAIRIDMVGNP